MTIADTAASVTPRDGRGRRRPWRTTVGASVLLLLATLALCAPLVAAHDPLRQDLALHLARHGVTRLRPVQPQIENRTGALDEYPDMRPAAELPDLTGLTKL